MSGRQLEIPLVHLTDVAAVVHLQASKSALLLAPCLQLTMLRTQQ
jgi:hypothetical protein